MPYRLIPSVPDPVSTVGLESRTCGTRKVDELACCYIGLTELWSEHWPDSCQPNLNLSTVFRVLSGDAIPQAKFDPKSERATVRSDFDFCCTGWRRQTDLSVLSHACRFKSEPG